VNDVKLHGHASYEPPLAYRITGRMNVAVWRLPLPPRVLVRLSALVYRNPPMPSGLVLKIADALDEAGVRYWIRGGWGVDALAGRQTRAHEDLDIVIDDHAHVRAVEAIEGLGFSRWYDVQSDVPLFSRIVLRDHPVAGRAVDLQPVEIVDGHMKFTIGTIDSRPVPCLELQMQLATHSNYRKRWRDHVDLVVLREVSREAASQSDGPSTGIRATEVRRPAMGRRMSAALAKLSRRVARRLFRGALSVLVVPVRSVDDLRDRSACEPGMPAHVTILYPFLRSRTINMEVERKLEAAMGETSEFEFVLNEVRRFSQAVVYLAPEPAAPFVALTKAVMRNWPSYEPYGGAFEEIVPHVTVAYGDETPDGVVEHLPLRVRVHEVWLMVRFGNRWVCRRRFNLGRASREAGS
jgi:2'-5' RNA ligase